MARTALVTGGTRGIGEAISIALKDAGYTVAANYGGNDEAANAFKEKTGIPVYKFDVGDFEACAAGVAAVEADLGPIEVLVNNAGIQHVAPIEKFPVENWNSILAINMSSVFHTTAAVLTGMRTRGWGLIINIASAHGLTASPFKSAYVTAKHGVVGLTKTIALETAEDPITCNAICPGYVLTPLVEAQIPDTMEQYGMDRETVIREVMLQRQPSKQFATAEQIGGCTTFLCSPAADQITGTTLSVDGGWTAL